MDVGITFSVGLLYCGILICESGVLRVFPFYPLPIAAFVLPSSALALRIDYKVGKEA